MRMGLIVFWWKKKVKLMDENIFTKKILYILLVFYVFSVLNYKDISEIVISVFVIAILFGMITKSIVIKNYFPCVIFILACLASLLTWLLTNLQEPEIATKSPRIEMLLMKFAFIPFAFVLDDKRKVLLLWGFLAIFSFLTPWLSGEGSESIKDVFNGTRSGLGNHIITMGMVYAVVLLGLLILYKDFIKCKYAKVSFVFWAISILCAALGVYASQTRAIYFAFVVVYILVLLFFLFKSKSIKNYIIFNAVMVFAVLFLNELGAFESIKSRFIEEQSTIFQIFSLERNLIPKNSAGLRMHFWMEAWEWIKQRPWTGWGESANHALHVKEGNYFEGRHFITIHNDVLEILLAYGLLGLLLFVAILLWLTHKVFSAWLVSKINTSFFVFYYVFIGFFITNSLFMSVLFFKESLLLWNIVLASYLGLVLSNENSSSRESHSTD